MAPSPYSTFDASPLDVGPAATEGPLSPDMHFAAVYCRLLLLMPDRVSQVASTAHQQPLTPAPKHSKILNRGCWVNWMLSHNHCTGDREPVSLGGCADAADHSAPDTPGRGRNYSGHDTRSGRGGASGNLRHRRWHQKHGRHWRGSTSLCLAVGLHLSPQFAAAVTSIVPLSSVANCDADTCL